MSDGSIDSRRKAMLNKSGQVRFNPFLGASKSKPGLQDGEKYLTRVGLKVLKSNHFPNNALMTVLSIVCNYSS
jgi:hypothetical protein